MRKNAANPNKIMEAAHLRPFYDGECWLPCTVWVIQWGLLPYKVPYRGAGSMNKTDDGIIAPVLMESARAHCRLGPTRHPRTTCCCSTEGSRQEADALQALFQERADRQDRCAAGRDHLRGTLAANARDKTVKLQRDTAVHEALLKRKVGSACRALHWLALLRKWLLGGWRELCLVYG